MNLIQSIIQWFKLAKPKPTNQNVVQQIAYHFEEVAEMCEALQFHNTAEEIKSIKQALLDYAENDDCDYFVSQIDKVALLDALCDQQVTAIGVGILLGFDMENGLDEVNKSNYSKFENNKPVIDAQGKIIKGKYYRKPELTQFVGE